MGYLVSLLPLIFIYGILVVGLNLQFGMTGILNFTYFTFVAIGAYADAVFSLGPASPASGMSYIGGSNLPFPLDVFAAGGVAAIAGVVISFGALRRLRSDYLAIVTVGAGYIVYTIIGNVTFLLNGWNGLFNVPTPVPGSLSANNQLLVFGGICFVFFVVVMFMVERVRRSPLGRLLRAIKDDEGVVEAFGRNVYGERLLIFTVGSFVAGMGGALLVQYATSFNPQSFLPPETFILWAAMIIGGAGNNWGAFIGAAIVPVGFAEITRFLPEIGRAGLVDSLRGVAVGLLLVLVLRFAPQGLFPERRPVDGGGAQGGPAMRRRWVPFAAVSGTSKENASREVQRA